MALTDRVGNFLRIDRPEWYKREDFLKWLNETKGLATWHTKGEAPDEYSDVFIVWEGEGAEPDLPKDIDEEITKLCDEKGFDECIVWISNVGDF